MFLLFRTFLILCLPGVTCNVRTQSPRKRNNDHGKSRITCGQDVLKTSNTSIYIHSPRTIDDDSRLSNTLSLYALHALAEAYRPYLGDNLADDTLLLGINDSARYPLFREKMFNSLQAPIGRGVLQKIVQQYADHMKSSFFPSLFAVSRYCRDYESDKLQLQRKPRSRHLLDSKVSNRHRQRKVTKHRIKNETFVQDKSNALHTAVCLVGVPRVLTRPDVATSLQYRFMAGWGFSEITLFALLVDDDLSNEVKAHVESILKKLR